MLEGFGRVKVEQERGSVKSFNPVGWWHASLKKKGTHHVISRANDTFGFTILGRGVWARHSKGGAEGKEKHVSSFIVKFATIVTLDRLDSCVKLGRDVGKEVFKCRESVRFCTQGKSPKVMGEII